MAHKHSVFIALTRLANGQDELGRTKYIRPGDHVPQVVDWPRADIAVARGDILELTPAACRAIVEVGMRDEEKDERSDSGNDSAHEAANELAKNAANELAKNAANELAKKSKPSKTR